MVKEYNLKGDKCESTKGKTIADYKRWKILKEPGNMWGAEFFVNINYWTLPTTAIITEIKG